MTEAQLLQWHCLPFFFFHNYFFFHYLQSQQSPILLQQKRLDGQTDKKRENKHTMLWHNPSSETAGRSRNGNVCIPRNCWEPRIMLQELWFCFDYRGKLDHSSPGWIFFWGRKVVLLLNMHKNVLFFHLF